MVHNRMGKIKRDFRYLNVILTREATLLYIHLEYTRCIN
jgi:hypothetical protein